MSITRWFLAAQFPALREVILQRSRTEPSFSSHNRGGWRTPPTLLDWPEAGVLRDALTELVERRAPRASPYKLQAWAVVNRNGSYHARHHHLGAPVLSGIYYMDRGDEPSARTIFDVNGEDVFVNPVEGLVVLFPSWMWHWTEVQFGDQPRITIAFDVI